MFKGHDCVGFVAGSSAAAPSVAGAAAAGAAAAQRKTAEGHGAGGAGAVDKKHEKSRMWRMWFPVINQNFDISTIDIVMPIVSYRLLILLY